MECFVAAEKAKNRLARCSAFSPSETNLRREGQLEGIAKAKAAGVFKGWPSIDQAQVEKLKADGLGATEIAKRLPSSFRIPPRKSPLRGWACSPAPGSGGLGSGHATG
jgi:hypothetical protein